MQRRRYKILGALLGAIFLTSAAAWLPVLTEWLERFDLTASEAGRLAYAIFFVLAAVVSYAFVTELIRARMQIKRCDEVLNTSAAMEMHDKQLFHTMGKKQILLAKRNGWPVSMIALYLHPMQGNKAAGDISLQIKEMVLEELEKVMRGSDLAGSFAKNEYLIFLQNCSESQSKEIAKRIKKRFSDKRVEVDGKLYRIECKCGVTTLDAGAAELKRLMERAFDVLERAKEKTGNVIEHF
ncbi:GGDEF domain-containing protein [Hydrogenimonas cancrithermarum]|uniref:GGDEF domain-containing protein n=1 Tax=Hydrogenimonas cancrithermarum TaxID=2993563 RepID=A0ABM8FP72_9BACT|nr:diguanylate cyclase [Hydrogenimonas cancrithermarum]BDY13490.1 hypothetical protein HCR_18020 [Hydrogenimonas cancrithermarum]